MKVVEEGYLIEKRRQYGPNYPFTGFGEPSERIEAVQLTDGTQMPFQEWKDQRDEQVAKEWEEERRANTPKPTKTDRAFETAFNIMNAPFALIRHLFPDPDLSHLSAPHAEPTTHSPQHYIRNLKFKALA